MPNGTNRGRRRQTRPNYFSFEIGPMNEQAALRGNDAELGKWFRTALADLSSGCVRENVDPFVREIYDHAFNGMKAKQENQANQYKRRKESNGAANLQTMPEKHPESDRTATNDQLVWGQFENVFLTQKQHDDFCVHVGNVNEAKQIIDSLSCKLADGSFNSSNHYATLMHWSNYRKEKAAEAVEIAKANADARAEAYSKRGYKTAEERQQEELAKINDFCTGLRNGTIKIAKEG